MRLAALVLATALAIPPAAQAASYRKGPIEVDGPWARPAAKGFNGAGYLTIVNRGKATETLTAIVFPDAGRVELHQSRISRGVASMAPMGQGIAIPPGATVRLEPGGAHAMLMGLKAPLVAGAKRPATLVFASGLKTPVEFLIRSDTPARSHAR